MKGPHGRRFFTWGHRLVERHAALRAEISYRQRRRSIKAGVAMDINALAGAHQIGQGVERGNQPCSHIVGAAVMDRRADQLHPEARADVAHLRHVQRIDAEIFVVLQVQDRGNAVFLVQPFKVAASWIFADQQMVGDLVQGRASDAASGTRFVIWPLGEPVHWENLIAAPRPSESHKPSAWMAPRRSS